MENMHENVRKFIGDSAQLQRDNNALFMSLNIKAYD